MPTWPRPRAPKQCSATKRWTSSAASDGAGDGTSDYRWPHCAVTQCKLRTGADQTSWTFVIGGLPLGRSLYVSGPPPEYWPPAPGAWDPGESSAHNSALTAAPARA